MTSAGQTPGSPSHVTLAVAAAHLQITAEAARLAIKRGDLTGFSEPAGSRVRHYVYVESILTFTPRGHKGKRQSRVRIGATPTRSGYRTAAAAAKDRRVRRHYLAAVRHLTLAIAELAEYDVSVARIREQLETTVANLNSAETADGDGSPREGN